MIISHKHKFIFIHLPRTSGRSVTSELARHCGPDDVISRTPGVSESNSGPVKRHASAAKIRKLIGREAWNRYFKFTIERNPWDKILSVFFANVKSARSLSPQEFDAEFGRWFDRKVLHGWLLNLGHYRLPRHLPLYTTGNRLDVDFIGRYENRDAHLKLVSDLLGLPIDPSVRVSKENRRDCGNHEQYFNLRRRRIVERIFRKDLMLLRYEFGSPPPMTPIVRDGSAYASAMQKLLGAPVRQTSA